MLLSLVTVSHHVPEWLCNILESLPDEEVRTYYSLQVNVMTFTDLNACTWFIRCMYNAICMPL